MPFSLSEVVNDPDIAQSAIILRSSGQFGPGEFKNQTTEIPLYGVITVASSKDLQQIPEGDRVRGAMMVVCQQELFQTSEDSNSLSDILVWRGEKYKLISSDPWVDFGFWKAIMVRMAGQ